MKRFSLKTRIIFCFLSAPLITFLLVSVFSLWGMAGLNRFALAIGREIGNDAAHEGMVALEQEFRDELTMRAEGQVLIIESRLRRISDGVAALADLYGDIADADASLGFVSPPDMEEIWNDGFSYLRFPPETAVDRLVLCNTENFGLDKLDYGLDFFVRADGRYEYRPRHERENTPIRNLPQGGCDLSSFDPHSLMAFDTSVSAASQNEANPSKYSQSKRNFKYYRALVARLAAMRGALRHLCVVDNYIVGAGIALPEGVYFGSARRPPPSVFDFRRQEWYLQALARQGQAAWVGPFRLGCEKIIVCAQAIKIDGESVAVAMIMVSPDAVSRDFVTTIGPETFAFLVNREGEMVALENPATDQLNWKYATTGAADFDERLLGAMMSGHGGIMNTVWRGRKLVVAYKPVPTTGWSIGVALERETIAASAREIRDRIGGEVAGFRLRTSRRIQHAAAVYLLLGASLGVIVVGFACRMAYGVNAKIRTLEEGAARLGGGDFEANISMKGDDEFRELAETFNQTAAGMKRYIAEFEKSVTERELREHEMSVASAIQRSMLPDPADVTAERSEIEIFAMMRPASQVGGDFYDFFHVDEHTLFFVVGDVSGKGTPAALFMARVMVLLRNEALERKKPDKIFLDVGNELAKNNDSCMFATALCGLLDVRSGEILLANAGHPCPFMRRGTGFEQLPLPRGSAIGAMRLESEDFALSRLVIDKGASLLIYTDGVSEAFNTDNAAFGEEGIAAALVNRGGASPYELGNALDAAVSAFAGAAPQSDDITVLILRFHG